MTIKLYKLHINISGETDSSVDASTTATDYPSLNITMAERNIAFTHFMDKEKCVEYLNLGRKLATTQALNVASGAGKPYAERTTFEQKQIYLKTTRAAFRCFLLAAKCANVNIISWNKLRRLMEVTTCISPGQTLGRYTDNVITSPIWPTSEHGLWRRAIGDLSIGANTWMPSVFNNPFWILSVSQSKLSANGNRYLAHIRIGSQSNFFISRDENVDDDSGMKYYVRNGNLSSTFLRARYPVPVWPGDAHPFWFSKDPTRANDFMSVGASGNPTASVVYGGVDGDPAENLIRQGADLGSVNDVNEYLGHIPGIRGVPGVKRDIFEAHSGSNIMYEACGTIPFDWYTRLFYSPVPGLMPSAGVDQQDLFVGEDYDSRPGVSIVDYILKIGIERWVCEVKQDAIANSQNFYDKMPESAKNSEGVLQYISNEISSLRSSDPGVAPIISAGGRAVTDMGGLIAKTGVGIIPGAIVSGVGLVASIIGAIIVGQQERTEQWKSFIWPVDVYGVPLAHDSSGKNIANPTSFLAFKPTTGGAGAYVGMMSREFIRQGSVATILSELPHDVQNVVSRMPSAVSGSTPPILESPSLFANYQPFPTTPMNSSKSVRINVLRNEHAASVFVTVGNRSLNDGDLFEPGKYKVTFSLAGVPYNAYEVKLIEGSDYNLNIPEPPIELIRRSLSETNHSSSNHSSGNSITPWLIAGGIAAAGYYGWKKYGK